MSVRDRKAFSWRIAIHYAFIIAVLTIYGGQV